MGVTSYEDAMGQHLAASAALAWPSVWGEFDTFLRCEAAGWCVYAPDDPAGRQRAQAVYDQVMNAPPALPPSPVTLVPAWTQEQYAQAFERVQDYLRAGDAYQINLTQPWLGRVHDSLVSWVDPLQQLTKAPYAGYVRVGDDELISCSPELFMTVDPQGVITTRPIKGTRPRGLTFEQDNRERSALLGSEKDRAENLMIVDLLRHDVGRHAVIGSVRVPELFAIESFPQVHHLVSTITAQRRPDHSTAQSILDALPGGSITGAPKLRAMQIIQELEAGPRGAYCGSMGYINGDGSAQMNILIRTLQRCGTEVSLWAGGGITVASNAEEEYRECQHKIGALIDRLQAGSVQSAADEAI